MRPSAISTSRPATSRSPDSSSTRAPVNNSAGGGAAAAPPPAAQTPRTTPTAAAIAATRATATSFAPRRQPSDRGQPSGNAGAESSATWSSSSPISPIRFADPVRRSCRSRRHRPSAARSAVPRANLPCAAARRRRRRPPRRRPTAACRSAAGSCRDQTRSDKLTPRGQSTAPGRAPGGRVEAWSCTTPGPAAAPVSREWSPARPTAARPLAPPAAARRGTKIEMAAGFRFTGKGPSWACDGAIEPPATSLGRHSSCASWSVE